MKVQKTTVQGSVPGLCTFRYDDALQEQNGIK